MTKTVMIFDQCGQEPIEFYVLDGDYTHLDGVYINSTATKPKLDRELTKLMYDTEGKRKMKHLLTFPHKAVVNGAKVIVCGFYP